MNETAETKICPFCAETIKAAAKKCPRCCSKLKGEGSWFLAMLQFGPVVLLLYGPILLGSWWLGGLNRPGRDFGPYRDKILISETAIHFGHLSNTNTVSTVGFLRNDSPYSWKALQLEIQYFDKEGKLVDSATETLPNQELPSGMTEAFRIRSPAAFDEISYATNKVFVRAAKDARKLFVYKD
jgi:hypothetical protein